MRSAAFAALYGIDPLRVLEEEDQLKLEALGRVLEHTQKLDAERREDLANRIAHRVLSGLGG